MNERIYELAEQAGAYCESLRGGDYKPPVLDLMNLEKFAQLIVRECLLKVNEIGYEVYEYDHSVVEKHVHNHFGVEL
jgi:hypothetical protein